MRWRPKQWNGRNPSGGWGWFRYWMGWTKSCLFAIVLFRIMSLRNVQKTMKNSVEIMCIDSCLNSSTIQKGWREKRKEVAIMYSSWFKEFYSPLRQNHLPLWDANSKVHHQQVFWAKYLRNNAKLVTIRAGLLRPLSRTTLLWILATSPKVGLARRLEGYLLIGSFIYCFVSQLKQLVKRASWRTKTK